MNETDKKKNPQFNSLALQLLLPCQMIQAPFFARHQKIRHIVGLRVNGEFIRILNGHEFR